MTNAKHIEEQVNATLASLDKVRKASPGPFFYTRVQARLQRRPESVWTRIYTLISTPSIAIGMILLVIMGDGMLIFMENDTNAAVSATAPDYSLSAQYQEYSLNNQEFYQYAFDESINADPQN